MQMSIYLQRAGLDRITHYRITSSIVQIVCPFLLNLFSARNNEKLCTDVRSLLIWMHRLTYTKT